MAHKDICIQFNLGNRKFEAVGFLEENEEELAVCEALKRVDNGLLVESEKDWEYILKHRFGLPCKLYDYTLHTSCRFVGQFPEFGTTLFPSICSNWFFYKGWSDLDKGSWGPCHLVLRWVKE